MFNTDLSTGCVILICPLDVRFLYVHSLLVICMLECDRECDKCLPEFHIRSQPDFVITNIFILLINPLFLNQTS